MNNDSFMKYYYYYYTVKLSKNFKLRLDIYVKVEKKFTFCVKLRTRS